MTQPRSNKTALSLSLAAALTAMSAAAAELPVPRGGAILPLASNCGIGPFDQTGKAGGYNAYCTVLTDAEKCLALVKRQMNNLDGTLDSDSFDKDRINYCLEEFRRGLLGQ